MINFQQFVDGNRTLLIAPAGYGKSYSIAASLQFTKGRQLILTHTHAGIASLKAKLKSSGVLSSRYAVETISSFAQKYVHAFVAASELPQQDTKEYHSAIIDKARIIVSHTIVQSVITNSYAGIFVDEYQDCSKQLHEFIIALASNLPLHILGDPLQGIFDFNGETIDMEKDLADFELFPELTVPNRWYQDNNNRYIGDEMVKFRQLLKDKKPLLLEQSTANDFFVVTVKDGDLRDSNSEYRKWLNGLITNKKNKPHLQSLLIIAPEYDETRPDGIQIRKGDIADRVKIRSQIDYGKSLSLLEAIDDRSFYSLAKTSDLLISGIARARNKAIRIKKDILEKIFAQTEIGEWFNNEGLKSKRSPADQLLSHQFEALLNTFIASPSGATLLDVINNAKKNLGCKIQREEIFYQFCRCLKNSTLQGISIYASMKESRNVIRRVGRKVTGKCIGTTLLTKGLEFDTVVILDAHKFACPKNLYVALTRCCKMLVIFSTSTTLNPYRNIYSHSSMPDSV